MLFTRHEPFKAHSCGPKPDDLHKLHVHARMPYIALSATAEKEGRSGVYAIQPTRVLSLSPHYYFVQILLPPCSGVAQGICCGALSPDILPIPPPSQVGNASLGIFIYLSRDSLRKQGLGSQTFNG